MLHAPAWHEGKDRREQKNERGSGAPTTLGSPQPQAQSLHGARGPGGGPTPAQTTLGTTWGKETSSAGGCWCWVEKEKPLRRSSHCSRPRGLRQLLVTAVTPQRSRVMSGGDMGPHCLGLPSQPGASHGKRKTQTHKERRQPETCRKKSRIRLTKTLIPRHRTQDM